MILNTIHHSPKEYLELCFFIQEIEVDYVIAELHEFGFTGFDETSTELRAYIEAENFYENVQIELDHFLATRNDIALVQTNTLVEKNWNEEWEKGIKPQRIGSFYVYPSWNREDQPHDLIPLHIDPKMAFGTGTHETTRLLLEWLPEVVNRGDRILDAGTGTGILAIASSKLGAREVFGFDIDPWSYENASENIEKNNITNVQVVEGSLDHPDISQTYDVIIANINTIALTEMAPKFLNYLNSKGTLLLSGLLSIDIDNFKEKVLAGKYQIIQERTMGEWAALWLQPIVS